MTHCHQTSVIHTLLPLGVRDDQMEKNNRMKSGMAACSCNQQQEDGKFEAVLDYTESSRPDSPPVRTFLQKRGWSQTNQKEHRLDHPHRGRFCSLEHPCYTCVLKHHPPSPKGPTQEFNSGKEPRDTAVLALASCRHSPTLTIPLALSKPSHRTEEKTQPSPGRDLVFWPHICSPFG